MPGNVGADSETAAVEAYMEGIQQKSKPLEAGEDLKGCKLVTICSAAGSCWKARTRGPDAAETQVR